MSLETRAVGIARLHTGVFDQSWVHVDGWRELVSVVVAFEQWVGELRVLLAWPAILGSVERILREPSV